MKITRRRYLLCGVFSFFVAILKPIKVLAISKQEQAELLTKKGHDLLNQGQYLLAFQAWKKATEFYQKLGFEEGVTGNLVNQSLALQGLGLHLNAFDVLLEALRINKSTYSPTSFRNQDPQKLYSAIRKIKLTPVNLLALQNLGEVLRLLGDLDESEVVLQEIIQSQTPNPYFPSFLLSLSNTKKSKYNRLTSQYEWVGELIYKKDIIDEIQNNALSTLKLYQQINDLENTPKTTKLKTQLNNLSFLFNFEEWLKLQKKQDFINKENISQKIQDLIALILQSYSFFDELSANQSVYAKLDFANNLSKTTDKQLQPIAIQFAESALKTAESLDNKLLQSFCWGTLGKLNPVKSEKYFNKALGFAQSIQAWDIAYQWQQQLADLYGKAGKFQEASHFYEAAITNLQQIRGNLLSTNPDAQFFFNEKIEPVYRDYIRLLLANSNPDFQKVIQINEEFKITELENYLQCGQLNLVSLNEVRNSDATIIHIIDLDNSIQVISQSGDSIHHHSIDSALIREPINNLLEILQSRNFAYTPEETILPDCQILHKLLIAPIQNLSSSKVLVFTLDTSFQSLPMGILHDGNYLIAHYAITYSLGSKIQFPKFFDSSQLRALIAGISKESPSFSAANAPKGLKPLPGVEKEIASIKEEITSTKILLNEQFVSSRLDRELMANDNDFPIVHLTTHAQFSSLAGRTMILAWDKPITILEFNDLLKEKMQQSKKAGLELLVLSACETATGNKRSALGIAGVAAQAGARSTVASLWQVDADSTALLMQQFYKGLKKLTKAEALRQAQLQMLSNPKYQHPSNWAAFLLVGSWL